MRMFVYLMAASIILTCILGVSSCIVTGDIITLKKDTLAGRIRAGEGGSLGPGTRYIDYRPNGADRYKPVNLDSVKWVRLMGKKDTIIFAPVVTMLPLRKFFFRKHLWTVLGTKDGYALCYLDWVLDDQDIASNSREVILIDQNNGQVLEVVPPWGDANTKQKLNKSFLKFINNRYQKDFTIEDFPSQKTLIDYILDKEVRPQDDNSSENNGS